MPWITPRVWINGPLDAASMNEISTQSQYLKDALDLIGATSDVTLKALRSRRYGCRLTNSADITIPDSTDKVLTWDTEDVDSTPALHSTTSATAQIKIPSGGDGDYDFWSEVRWVTNATGQRWLWFEVNGSGGTGTQYGRQSTNALGGPNQTYMSTSAYIPGLVAGDYVTCNVRQSSTAALDVGLSAGVGQSFSGARRFAS
jgi:hypothetical protein